MLNFFKKDKKTESVPEIYFKNTLTNKEEKFKPLKDGAVSIYHCGPTVYNKAHIGNMRAYVFADLLGRLFRNNNYKVKQVINITDVGHLISDEDEGEDKIEKSAKEKGLTAKEIVDEYTGLFMEDIEKLNIDASPIIFPKATDHIKEQIDLIKILEEKGVTYKISDGIYYDTSKFPEYGVLGNVIVKQQMAGARVEKNSEKKNPTDFALWKFSPKDEKRQQEWESPWGVGFPGWHLECSAMSHKHLGKKFDIHTGGIDHIQIHHNNEIAQSQKAFGEVQANYWLHHNHIMIDNQKMSKSTGSILYLSDLQEKNIDPIVYRYWLLTSHYSTLANFTWEAIKSADVAYKKILNTFKNAVIGKTNQEYFVSAQKHLGQNLDTPQVIALIWNIIKDDSLTLEDKYATVLEIDKFLGLKIGENSSKSVEIEMPADITEKAQKRQEMRKSGDFKEADRLRDEILEAGYEIIDKGGDFEICKK